MIEVGALEAEMQFSSLLDQVIQGEEVLITRRGTPVARLVPARHAGRTSTEPAIEQLRSIRRNVRLGGLGWKILRDQRCI